MFLDSDDLLAQSCLEHRVQTIIDKPYDFIVTQTGIIRKSNPQIKKYGVLYCIKMMLRHLSKWKVGVYPQLSSEVIS